MSGITMMGYAVPAPDLPSDLSVWPDWQGAFTSGEVADRSGTVLAGWSAERARRAGAGPGPRR
jgi:hypothetical protein